LLGYYTGRVLATVYIGLGANLGDRGANLRQAQRLIAHRIGPIERVSSIYETEPMEFVAQPWFLNCVAQVTTERDPAKVMQLLLQIEEEMGRRRDQSKGPRLIDLDILLFGNLVVNTPELTVPHPAMHLRRFVLEPLAEIAPNVVHPVFMRSASELLSALPRAGSAVRLMEIEAANG
jgi:2-amino-4-hydroxy-6-hydroxymethyldihydropteridine diphosphokinase